MSLYFCEKENNNCIKKDECHRYVNSYQECTATLFKKMCTEENNYLLFIQNEKKEVEFD